MGRTIEERLADMEAVHQITNLKARYLNACDGGWNRPSHNADVVAALFAEDGWWEAEGFPRLVGREGIRVAFKSFSIQAPFAFHAVSNPLIEVSGGAATGEWHLTEMFTDTEGTEFWAAAIYKNTFLRAAEGWLFQTLSVSYAYNGPYKNGWASAIKRPGAASTRT